MSRSLYPLCSVNGARHLNKQANGEHSDLDGPLHPLTLWQPPADKPAAHEYFGNSASEKRLFPRSV